MTLPLQPGSVRLMLIREVDSGTIVDAEVFFDGAEAERARDTLLIGLTGEFRDYRPDSPQADPAVSADAAGQLAAIRDLLARFDWEYHDRQLALEEIERIAGGAE